MFIHELRMAVASEQHAEIIEPCYDALQFDSIDEKYRERRFVFADVIEKSVL